MTFFLLFGLASAAVGETPPAELLFGGPPRAIIDLNEARLLVLSYDHKGRLDGKEQRFVEELGLVLDGFTIEIVKVEKPGFPRIALPNQVKLVEPLLGEHRALAAVWLAEPSPGWLMVYLVALQTGQTLVRTVQSGGAASEAELALAVRELLGTAWLFTPPEAVGPPAMQELVESVRDQVIAYGRRYRGGMSAVALRSDVTARMALSKQVRADSVIGVNGGVDIEIIEDMWGGFGLGLSTRPSRSTRVFQNISSWGVIPFTTLAYDPLALNLRSGRLSLGLWGGVGFEWEQFTFDLGGEDNSRGTSRMWLKSGLALRWFFSRRVGVVMSPNVGWTTNRGFYHARSTNDVIVATPKYEWGFSLGVLVRPWR